MATVASNELRASANVTIFEVEGLRWKEQSKQIRARLKPEDADELENLLATDSDLRYAARRPLVLRGVIELAARGSIEQCSTLDFLASAVHQHEQRLPRLAVLDDAPLDGYARQYLEGIATAMLAEVATVIDREPVLQAITRVARSLVSDGLLSTPPRASDVLAALTGQHLLQAESDKIRFSHQLFQEFFAANALLNSLMLGDPESEVLKSAVTAPGWGEALALVSEVLRQRSLVRERTLLVSSALRVDLGLACDLAGQSGFDAADDDATYQLCIPVAQSDDFSPLLQEGKALRVAARHPSRKPFLDSGDERSVCSE